MFEKAKKMGIAWDIKKEDWGKHFSFKNSQLYGGLNNDKIGLKYLFNIEKKNEKEAQKILGKRYSDLYDYILSSFFVNFQYLVEFLNRFHKELGINKNSLIYINDGFDDLYISIRLSMMGHYRTAFFHLRSFIENYFNIILNYCDNKGLLNSTNGKKIKNTTSIKGRMNFIHNLKSKEPNLYKEFFFDGYELHKLYNYLSKYTHSIGPKTNGFDFNLEEFDKYFRIGGITLLIVSRMLYAFFGIEIEENRLYIAEKPVPYSPSHYRRIFGEMLLSDGLLFNMLYERKNDKKLFVDKILLDVHKLVYNAQESIDEHNAREEDRKTFIKLQKKILKNSSQEGFKYLKMIIEEYEDDGHKIEGLFTKETIGLSDTERLQILYEAQGRDIIAENSGPLIPKGGYKYKYKGTPNPEFDFSKYLKIK